MATVFSAVLPGQSAASAADFRINCQFAHDTFALGLTQTADTGQINLSTVTAPTGGNQSQGYEIWRFNDTLQATKPVYLKVEYGSGSGSQHQFALWFTIGTGSNGSGTITGTLFSRTQYYGANTAAGTVHNGYGSAANNRFTLAMHLSSGGTSIGHFYSLERTKDVDGADTAVGLIWATYNQITTRITVLPFSAAAPPSELGWNFILSTNNPTAYTGDQGIGLVIPMLGVAIQPGMNVCVTNSNDFLAFATVNMSIYGATHTYQHLGANISNLRAGSTGNADTGTRCLMRYE